MVERLRYQFGVAAQCLQNISLDRRIIGPRHFVFVTRRNDHGGDSTKIVALGLVEF